MDRIPKRWRRFYGQRPLHLLALLGCFALAGYAVSFAATAPMALRMLIWFIGALLGHDLLLFPLYALADRSLLAGRWAHRKLARGRAPRVPALNYLRVPALGSGLLGIVFYPSISRQGEPAYLAASGLTDEPYLRRWLLLTGVFFLASAVLYATRLSRARRAATPRSPPARPTGSSPPRPAATGDQATPT